jgi:ADP-ribose pyrophosphatase YjhB (NUDIX family)
MNRRVAVRGIVLHDGKLLCVRLKPYKPNITVTAEQWATPGGGVDIGEPLLPAFEREMIEETGIKPAIGNLLYVQQFIHNDTEQMEFFFHVTNSQDYLNIDLSKTTHGNIEIAEIDFVETASTNLLPEFLRTESFANFDPHAPTKFYNFIP